MLRLFDTATGTIRPLEARREGELAIYVCGLTVYDLPHIGHGRLALVFDILRRYQLFRGISVRFVSNITDIDDHIIDRAAEEGRSEAEVASEFEARWWEALDALSVLPPDVAPHATQYVEQMIELIGDLVERGFAYETPDGVYLEVGKIDGYGLLAPGPLESLRAGARVEIDEEKRSPLDFVLWKKAKPGEPTWPSRFGPGRPGWHTECVVMSLDLLGADFDVHGGGIDLRFPHHENERAQAIAHGDRFARHWVHNGWVVTSGEKMSKSLGNFTTLTDFLENHDPRAYRLLVLGSHYRSPIEVTPVNIEQAEQSLARLDALARRFDLDDTLDGRREFVNAKELGSDLDADSFEMFCRHLDDDLDTPGALAAIFELVGQANSLADKGDIDRATTLARTAATLCAALGLSLRGRSVLELDAETTRLIEERDEAREARDWARADRIRDELVGRGFVVEDGPSGTTVRR
jgi:cysteinyl-tRNA synthetase